ncbi:MAG: alpha/beta hydrolase [Cytophagaceae bacterium]|nr:alpha/beta hydrolase [Cytophagaceae bacterium]
MQHSNEKQRVLKRFDEQTLWKGLLKKARFTFSFIVLFTVVVSSCNDHKIPSQPVKLISPTGPPPEWAPNIDPQMLAVIEELLRLNPIPLWTLSAQEARTKPTVKDAVLSLLAKNGVAPKPANVDVSMIVIPGPAGNGIRSVVYKPRNLSGPLPVIVYYHGGGWVLANPEVYEASTVALAEKVGAIVVSVEYRKSPENKFPAAHEDAYTAYKWVRDNTASIGGNPAKVAVAGESAGGNMAATVSMMARDRGIALPLHQLLVYPVANNDLNTPSYNIYANAKPLDRPLIIWFVDKYFRTPADGDSPLISLVDVANLSGLPPVTIIAAQIDPLLSEGEQLAKKYAQVGVPVVYQKYDGVTHEFFGTDAVVPKAGQAQDFAAARLRSAFQ